MLKDNKLVNQNKADYTKLFFLSVDVSILRISYSDFLRKFIHWVFTIVLKSYSLLFLRKFCSIPKIIASGTDFQLSKSESNFGFDLKKNNNKKSNFSILAPILFKCYLQLHSQ